MKGLFDLDAAKYICSAVGQKNSIKATLKSSGDEFTFKTRTEMYGRTKAKNGEWLGKYNLEKDTDLTVDDFIIEDVIIPEPIENVLHTTKLTIEGAVAASKVKSWKGFIGEGDSFRVELSTLLKYKDGRSLLKPYHFEAVVDYIKRKYNPEVTTFIENDDRLITLADGKKNIVILINDKDYKSYNVNVLDINKPDDGVIYCGGFGKLWLDDKNNVRGLGRLFKYFQIISGDSVDNYKANCFSDTAWAEKSAYKVLANCKDDKEAWQVMLDTFKMLYPEPKKVIGWRGNEIQIDHMYVFQEMMNMAHLHRWENDFVNVKDVLTKLEIEL